MNTLPIHYVVDGIGALMVFALSFAIRLGHLGLVKGIRVGKLRDPDGFARTLSMQLALMPGCVLMADLAEMAAGDIGAWHLIFPAFRVAAVAGIALWIHRTHRKAVS